MRELCRRLRFQASAARALCRLHMLLVLTADASLVAHADVVLAAAEDNARELSGELLDDPNRSLVEEQVRNGIPVRMALLYLMAASEPASSAAGLS